MLCERRGEAFFHFIGLIILSFEWRKIENFFFLTGEGRGKTTTMSAKNLSLCIPRVFSNITWKQVKEVFEGLLGKGCVERVDLISKTGESGEQFGRVFVHLRYWPRTEQATSFRKQLIEGGQVKIVYDDPWFWKVSISRVAKPERNRERVAPYIEGITPPAPTDDRNELSDASTERGDAPASSRSVHFREPEFTLPGSPTRDPPADASAAAPEAVAVGRQASLASLGSLTELMARIKTHLETRTKRIGQWDNCSHRDVLGEANDLLGLAGGGPFLEQADEILVAFEERAFSGRVDDHLGAAE